MVVHGEPAEDCVLAALAVTHGACVGSLDGKGYTAWWVVVARGLGP